MDSRVDIFSSVFLPSRRKSKYEVISWRGVIHPYPTSNNQVRGFKMYIWKGKAKRRIVLIGYFVFVPQWEIRKILW
jgi:hypothetical protein